MQESSGYIETRFRLASEMYSLFALITCGINDRPELKHVSRPGSALNTSKTTNPHKQKCFENSGNLCEGISDSGTNDHAVGRS